MNTREIMVEQPRIYSPKRGVIYCVVNPRLPGYVTRVKFHGELVERCAWYNAQVFSNEIRGGAAPMVGALHEESGQDFVVPLSAESLSIYRQPTPPVLIYRTQGELLFPTEMNVYITPTENYTSIQPDHCVPYDAITIAPENERIRAACLQQLSGHVDISIGIYPIMTNQAKPTKQFFDDIFQTFLACNSDEQLEQQFEDTRLFCHMRAHFVNELLRCYQIPSAKIFKRWEVSDWYDSRFCDHDIWKFHAAAVVIDNKFKLWVFDPWSGLNHHLLSLEEWLFRKDEPTPRKVIVTSWTQSTCMASSNTAYGTSVQDHSDIFFKNLQAIFSSAVPNPPRLNRFGFFKREEIQQTSESPVLLPSRFN